MLLKILDARSRLGYFFLTGPRLEFLEQREGLRALARPTIAEGLGLSDDQIKTIEDAVEAARSAAEEGGLDRDGFIAVRDEMNETILSALTDDQKTAWEAMLGEEFELARSQRPGMAAASED